MTRRSWVFVFFLIILLWVIVTAGSASATPQKVAPTPTSAPNPPSRIATAEEVLAAKASWARSRHANTYDAGLGANTTCANCKSPRNWDPHAPAAEAAENCSQCKREPGKPRPDLPGGAPVTQPDWKGIACDICHEPVGTSYSTALAYWNQETQRYEAMSSSTQLCAKCHVGQHGFDVIYEQSTSAAHKGWECTRCHGSHNSPVQCTDCHNPSQGRGSSAHAQHPDVSCTSCHDAGGLTIWQDSDPNSRFYQKYMPQRMAHALRSWPSHNLQTAVDCRRCHHPQGESQTTVAGRVRCDTQGCHPEGAVMNWCPLFPRDPAPKGLPQ